MRTRDVLVLCYHALSAEWPADLSITPARFERHIRSIRRRGYRGATFHQAVTAPPAPKTVAVTFDDAYRSVLELAFPILSRHGLPGSVFVPTSFAGTEAPMAWPGIDQWLDGPFRSELTPMCWEELARLRDAGWEIGSHSRSHPRLTGLDDDALSAELQGSRRDCEARLGAPCLSVAYPYGDFDARVAQAAREAGYRAAGTLERDGRGPEALAWPRIGVYHGDGSWRFRLKVARMTRRGGAWTSTG